MEYSELIIITGVALKRTCSSAHYNTYILERLCRRLGSVRADDNNIIYAIPLLLYSSLLL